MGVHGQQAAGARFARTPQYCRHMLPLMVFLDRQARRTLLDKLAKVYQTRRQFAFPAPRLGQACTLGEKPAQNCSEWPAAVMDHD